jgi:hypothetical protein
MLSFDEITYPPHPPPTHTHNFGVGAALAR